MRTRLRFSERIHRALANWNGGGRGAIKSGIDVAAARVLAKAQESHVRPPEYECAYVMRFEPKTLNGLRELSGRTGQSINQMIYRELEEMVAESCAVAKEEQE